MEIFHCSSGYHKWVTMGELITMGKTISRKVPLNDILWVPKGDITTYRLLAYVNMIFFQLIPAMFLDLLLKFHGQKMM